MILEKTLYNLRKSKHGFFNIKNGDLVDIETLKPNIRFTDMYNNISKKYFIFRKKVIRDYIYFFRFHQGESFYLTKDKKSGIYFI